MNTITAIFVLLVVAQIKHFVADYPLQTSWHLLKFRKTGWVLPLASHAGVHAAFTFVIALVFFVIQNLTEMVADWHLPTVILVTAIDFVIHFAMDRIKASPEMLGRFKALSANEFPVATEQQKRSNKYFWWALGLDQMVHHLTDIGIIYILAVASH